MDAQDAACPASEAQLRLLNLAHVLFALLILAVVARRAAGGLGEHDVPPSSGGGARGRRSATPTQPRVQVSSAGVRSTRCQPAVFHN